MTISGSCNPSDSGFGQPGTNISAGAAFGEPGLTISNHVVLSGLSITGFKGYGISLNGSNNIIKCSWIGTSDGISSKFNSQGGILINGNNNSLGTPDGLINGNLISGNIGVGVQVNSGTHNQAYFNIVGLQIYGSLPLTNSGGGLVIKNGGQLILKNGNKIRS